MTLPELREAESLQREELDKYVVYFYPRAIFRHPPTRIYFFGYLVTNNVDNLSSVHLWVGYAGGYVDDQFPIPAGGGCT